VSSPDERRASTARPQTRGRTVRRGRSGPLPTVVAELRNDALVDGRYRILRRATRWAVGSAFPAVDTAEGTPVVVVLPAIGPDEAVGFLARARVEVERTRPLHQSHIVTLRDCGVLHEGLPYFVLRRVKGTSLLRHVRGRGAIGTDLALHLVERFLVLAQLAHERGVILGDIRPANIILTTDEGKSATPEVVDLGFARGVFSGLLSLPKPPAAYRSPQARRGRPLCPADDVYAIGAVFYFMLTGKSPRKAALSGADRPHRIIAPPSFVRPDLDLSVYVDKVVLQALAAEREQRFRGIADMLLAVRGLRELFSLSSAARAVLRLPAEDTASQVDAFESDPTCELGAQQLLPRLGFDKSAVTDDSPTAPDLSTEAPPAPAPPSPAEPLLDESTPTEEIPAPDAGRERVEAETVPLDLEPLGRATSPGPIREPDAPTQVFSGPARERSNPRDDSAASRVVRLPSGRLPRVASSAGVGRRPADGDRRAGRLPQAIVAVTDSEVLMEPLELGREPAPLTPPSPEPSSSLRIRRPLLAPLVMILLLVSGLAIIFWVATHGSPPEVSPHPRGAAQRPTGPIVEPVPPPVAAEAPPETADVPAPPMVAAKPTPPAKRPAAVVHDTVVLRINTLPAGARVVRHKNDHVMCRATPCAFRYAKLAPGSNIRLRFEHPGYEHAIRLLPIDRGGAHTITLTARETAPPKPAANEDSPAPPDDAPAYAPPLVDPF